MNTACNALQVLGTRGEAQNVTVITNNSNRRFHARNTGPV